jgi:hypothetical protein
VKKIHPLGHDDLDVALLIAMRPRHREHACYAIAFGDHLALRETEIRGIASQAHNEFGECLPSADAFRRARTEEDDVRGENVFRRRQIASVQEIKVTTDQAPVRLSAWTHAALVMSVAQVSRGVSGK